MNKPQKIKGAVKKVDFWIGIGTMIAISYILFLGTKNVLSYVYSKKIVAKKVDYVSPIPKEANTPTPSPTASPLARIKKFANTGAVVVSVKEGDTFWSLSLKTCKTGVFYKTIEEINGYGKYRYLQPNDLITISCEM